MRTLALCAALAAASLLTFAPAVHHGFLGYDDDVWVTANPLVLPGLSPGSVARAFSSFHGSNWVPLAWISHQADVELFGTDPRGHHLVSVLLHAANALLLFGAFRALTGSLWRSFLLAALFAVHPLRVESVAWVAERKDVLSALFSFAALLAYRSYVSRPAAGRYLAALALFSCGCLSKPMAVTLPLLLLLLDFWPLGRLGPAGAARPGAHPAARAVLREKVPFFLVAGAVGAATLLAQRAGGAVNPLSLFPLWARAGNALSAWGTYLLRLAWPVGLAPFYPHPGTALPPWQAGAGAAALLLGTVWVVRERRRRPFLALGWLWHLLALLPVIGLVQVGSQAMADRYTYVPLVGILVAAIWGVGEALPRRRAPRLAVAGASAVLIAALALSARSQVSYWRDDRTLFSRALEVTSGNYVAHVMLGNAAVRERRFGEAAGHFEEAIRIEPLFPQSYSNLGLALAAQGRYEEAAARYREAVRLQPGNPRARYNLGVVLESSGRAAEARAALDEALALRPDFPEARAALERLGPGRAGRP